MQDGAPRPGQLPEYLHNADYGLVVNVGVAGGAGCGKSSLVNALRGASTREKFAATVGCTEQVDHPVAFPLSDKVLGARRGDKPSKSKPVLLWDLPAAGTQACPQDTYCEELGLRHFDFVILVVARRITEVDKIVLTFLEQFSVPHFVVRTKLDVDVRNETQDYERTPAQTLKSVGEEMTTRLSQGAFLVSTKRSSGFDLERLRFCLFAWLWLHYQPLADANCCPLCGERFADAPDNGASENGGGLSARGRTPRAPRAPAGDSGDSWVYRLICGTSALMLPAGSTNGSSMVRAWTVKVERPSGVNVTMGIDVDKTSLSVVQVLDQGLIKDWNDANPSAAVQPGDRLLRANGQATPAAIFAQCQAESQLELLFCREAPRQPKGDAGAGGVEGQSPFPPPPQQPQQSKPQEPQEPLPAAGTTGRDRRSVACSTCEAKLCADCVAQMGEEGEVLCPACNGPMQQASSWPLLAYITWWWS